MRRTSLVLASIVVLAALAPVLCSRAEEAKAEAEPALVREISAQETHDSKPMRLSWSDDDKEIYINSFAIEDRGKMKFYHFVLKADGSGFEQAERSPAWAEKYWSWKSPLKAPKGQAELREKKLDVNTASGRSLDGFQGNLPSVRVFLGKQELREFLGEQNVLGMWYGWGPENTDTLAYVNGKGSLCAVSYDGSDNRTLCKGKYTVPAWSNGGDRIAFVETKKDGKLWRVLVARVK